jgi:cytochrome P450
VGQAWKCAFSSASPPLQRPNGCAVYDLSRPYGGAAALLNLQGAEHAKRRRLWDRAFAPGSLAAYTPMLQARVAQFVAALAARAGTGARVDLTRWIQFLTLDFMGDFAYGGAFNALQSDADPDGLLATIAQGTAFVACVGWLPWLRPLVVALASGPGARLFAASRTVGERRKARGTAHKDLFYYVLGGDGGAGEALHPNTLAQEAVTAIIAGTDTSARTLLCAVFFLLAQPAALARVRAEVDGVVRELGDADAGLDPARLAQLPFLQAVL